MKSLFSVIVAVVSIFAFEDCGASDTKIAEEGGETTPSSSSSASSEPKVPTIIEFHRRLSVATAAAENLDGYTAILDMQEEINGELRSSDMVDAKYRREPFSVYMHWSGSDQEVLFVDGQNDNRMLVKPTKGLMAIKRVWRLEPNCAMAMQSFRYPVTDSGVERLTARAVEFYKSREGQLENLKCEVSIAKVEDRNVDVFELSFDDTSDTPLYCRSRLCFDTETELLMALENFAWNADKSAVRLIEKYAYRSIEPNVNLTDGDFDLNNPEYAFVKR